MQVLDKGFVNLIDNMGSDMTVVNSARVSFDKRSDEIGRDGFLKNQSEFLKEFGDVSYISNALSPKKQIEYEYHSFYNAMHTEPPNYLSFEDFKLIDYLAKHKHYSPFRHVQLQFHVRAPEFVMRQWYKHVVGIAYSEMPSVDHAWNEISMRYVNMSDAGFYIPDKYRLQSANNKQASEKFIENEETNKLATHLVQQSVEQSILRYNKLIEAGVAKEQARMVLPLNVYTEVYWSVSLQALINFINLRDHEGAQWEIQEYAKKLRHLVNKVCPVSAHALLKYSNH